MKQTPQSCIVCVMSPGQEIELQPIPPGVWGWLCPLSSLPTSWAHRPDASLSLPVTCLQGLPQSLEPLPLQACCSRSSSPLRDGGNFPCHPTRRCGRWTPFGEGARPHKEGNTIFMPHFSMQPWEHLSRGERPPQRWRRCVFCLFRVQMGWG